MMAAKPKLTPEQWLECQHRWEADHRDGYQWLVDEMNLPVSTPAVRKAAMKDGWRKSGSMKSIVQRAHIQADAKSAAKVSLKVSPETMLPTETINPSISITEAAVDLRSGVIENHRDEWGEHRTTFPMSDMLGEDGLGIARVAKTVAESIKIRQEGERKAWGLDALVQEDNSAISQDDLDEIYNAGMKRVEEMGRLAQKQYAELNVVGDGEAAD